MGRWLAAEMRDSFIGQHEHGNEDENRKLLTLGSGASATKSWAFMISHFCDILCCPERAIINREAEN